METKKELVKLKEEVRRKKLELANIMDTGGSLTVMTPGYTETENEINFLEDRIKNPERQLKNLPLTNGNEITVGSIVTLKNIKSGEVKEYRISLTIPSPLPKDYKIATPNSPVGKELMGKKNGAKITFTTRGNSGKLEIIKFNS